MATTVQLLNIDSKQHSLQIKSSPYNKTLPPAFRTAQGNFGTSFVGAATAVDLADLAPRGRSKLQRMLASGNLVVLTNATLS